MFARDTAAVLTVAIEGGLRILEGNGRVPDLYFVAAAVLTPVLALGLLPAATVRVRAPRLWARP